MNITCPTNKVEEVIDLIKAGADELYLGYNVDETITSVNRRYFKESSFTSLNDIKQVCQLSSVPVYLAMNAPFYDGYWNIKKIIKKSIKYGINGIIVADIPLLLWINKKFPNTKKIISTVATALNTDAVKFYKSLGANRVILPRHLTFDEIKKIRENVDIELETFMLFDWCKNIDGMCTFHHGMESLLNVEHGCAYANDYILNGNKGDFELNNKDELNIKNNLNLKINIKKRIIKERIKKIKFENFCAACYLNQFKDIGINAVKIAGRRMPTETKLKAVKFIKESFNGNCEKLYLKTFNRRCPRMCNAY